MKKNTYWIVGIFLCLAVFAANSNAQTTTIDTDTVWATGTGPYTQTNLFISDATLTIEPGVIVKFNDGGLLKVQAGGRIMATGATFTWADGVNEWRGIQFVEGDSRSRLENCIIEHASGYDSINARAMVFIGGIPLPHIPLRRSSAAPSATALLCAASMSRTPVRKSSTTPSPGSAATAFT